jgi:C4-dicarboxylate-specific signal transduction histidine kinase
MFNNGRVTGLQGFCRDVTQAKLADAERARLQAQLEQASRLTSLGRLAATIAHEFNNVLMGI